MNPLTVTRSVGYSSAASVPAQTAPLLPTPRGGFVAAPPRGGLRRFSVDETNTKVTIRASIGSAESVCTFHTIEAALRGAVARKKRQICVHVQARTKLTWMLVCAPRRKTPRSPPLEQSTPTPPPEEEASRRIA